MKILFLPKYHKEGPSSRYRTFNFAEYFRKRGHIVTIKPLLYDGYVKDIYTGKKRAYLLPKIIYCYVKRFFFLIFNAHKFDVLFIEKELFPKIPYFLESIVLKKAKYILDFDDAVFVNYENKIFLRNKVHLLSRNSILTTVCNLWYFGYIKSSKLFHLPTLIDIDRYKVKNYNIDQTNDIVKIVWIGSKTTQRYLEKLRNVFKRLSKVIDFKVILIGSGEKIDLAVDTEIYKWSEEEEVNLIRQADIGIMPLDNGTFEKGKCGLKLIQYMACGLPVVASNSPANSEIVSPDCGFLVESEDEWYHSLLKLVTNRELRISMGLKARERIEKLYCYQALADNFIHKVESIVESFTGEK